MQRHMSFLAIMIGTLMLCIACGGSSGKPVHFVGGTTDDGNAPEIVSIWPLAVDEDRHYEMRAEVLGSSPLEYKWDFGGGGYPNESTSHYPVIHFPEAGIFPCSLQISNQYGSTTAPFEMTVGGPLPEVSDFEASYGAVEGAIRLTWHADSEVSEIEGFRLRRKTRTEDSYEVIAELSPEAREYDDQMPPGLVAQYALEAWNEFGTNAYFSYGDYEPHEPIPMYFTRAIGWATSEKPQLLGEHILYENCERITWVDGYPLIITMTKEDSGYYQIDYGVNNAEDGSGMWLTASVPLIQMERYEEPCIVDTEDGALIAAYNSSDEQDECGFRIAWTPDPLDTENWTVTELGLSEEHLDLDHVQGVTADGRIFLLFSRGPTSIGALVLAYSAVPPTENSWEFVNIAEYTYAPLMGIFQDQMLICFKIHSLGDYFIAHANASASIIAPSFVETNRINGDILLSGPDYPVLFNSYYMYIPTECPSLAIWKEVISLRAGAYPNTFEKVICQWNEMPVGVTYRRDLRIDQGQPSEVTEFGLNVYAGIESGGPTYYFPLRETVAYDHLSHAAISGDTLMIASEASDIVATHISFYDLSGISIPEL